MFIAFAGAIALLLATAPPQSPLKTGTFAPPFLLKTVNPKLSGLEVFSTKTFVGSRATDKKRALLINFAASYCGPCKKELPELQKLAKAYAPRGVLFAVVIVDKEKEGQEAMRKLLVETLALTSPALLDRFAIVGRRYNAETLPLSVIVGGDGKVRWLHSGYKADTIASIRTELDKVAAPPAAAPPPPATDEPAPETKPKKKKKKKKKQRTPKK